MSRCKVCKANFVSDFERDLHEANEHKPCKRCKEPAEKLNRWGECELCEADLVDTGQEYDV